MKHFILATAGHVDHGKTALIKALTGTDTDRLPEEKKRGITIELGFAHLELPGFSIGVIDVPGHEDFVRNMIAGVGAVDLALLVVAADDGWMPQTEEHLQILTYLGVTRAVVALTKADLGDVDQREHEIRKNLENSPFSDAPIVATSVARAIGFEELKATLGCEFAKLPAPLDCGRPRLFVDRVFTVHGSGTIVTGTLSGGCFARGDSVLVQPQNLKARIRGLQSHNHALESAGPRRRLALNLADVSPEQVPRGSIIQAADDPALSSDVIDVLLSSSSRRRRNRRGIRNGGTVNFHFGSKRLAARVQLRRLETAGPGTRAMARLRLAEPVCALLGDRFILRDSSERETLAGGLVLDATPGRMKFRSTTQRALLDRRAIAPNELSVLVETELERAGFVSRSDLLPNAAVSKGEMTDVLESLGKSGRIFLDETLAASAPWWDSLLRSAARLIEAEHTDHSERPGLDLTRLRDGLEIEQSELVTALVRGLAAKGYEQHGNAIRRANFQPALPPPLRAAGDRMRAALAARPFDPPSRKELAGDALAQQALRFLRETGQVIEIASDVVLARDALEEMRERVLQHLRVNGGATVSDLRKSLGSSRRVMVPLLEYFDRTGITRRVGDKRVLR